MGEISQADKDLLRYAREKAEQEKLELETQALRHQNSWPARVAEALKSAVVIVGGVLTLGIGYNLTKLEHENLKQEITKNQEANTKLKSEREVLEKRNTELNEAIASAKPQIRRVTESVEKATKQISALKKEVSAAAIGPGAEVLGKVTTELSKLQQNFIAIDANAGDASVSLLTAKPAVPQTSAAGVTPMDSLVAELFAPTAGRRGAAYQALISSFSTNPNLVPALLARAQAEPKNLNGLYNVLVVLGHLSPLPSGTDVAAVREFALANRGKGPRIAGRAEKVLERLPEKAK